MTGVKYDSVAWELKKREDDLLDVFHRNCLQNGNSLTILNSMLYERCGLVMLSRVIMRAWGISMICNIPGTAKGIQLKLSENINGDVDLN